MLEMAAMSGAMAGVAASQAAAASAAAHRAEVARCKVVIDTFDNSTANVTEMRDYASCVRTVYPQPMNTTEVTAAKVLFVLALIGAGIGLYKSLHESWHDTSDHVLFFLFGFFGLPIASAFVGGVCMGIVWLFS
jgi:hypothetical protein